MCNETRTGPDYDSPQFIFQRPVAADMRELGRIISTSTIVQWSPTPEDAEYVGCQGSREEVLAYIHPILAETYEEHIEEQVDDPEQSFHFLVAESWEDPRNIDIVGRISFSDQRGSVFYTLMEIQRFSEQEYVVWYS